MRRLLLTIALLSASYASYGAISCTAKVDRFSDSDPLHLNSELEVIFNDGEYYKAEAQIGEYYFSINGNLAEDSYMIGIYQGPDYTSGTLAKGSFNGDKTFKLANVNGNFVTTIECKQ